MVEVPASHGTHYQGAIIILMKNMVTNIEYPSFKHGHFRVDVQPLVPVQIQSKTSNLRYHLQFVQIISI
jgi:phosphatidylserine synthase